MRNKYYIFHTSCDYVDAVCSLIKFVGGSVLQSLQIGKFQKEALIIIKYIADYPGYKWWY